MTGLAAAEAQLNGALGRLFAAGRGLSRPQGQPEHAVLQEELTSTENKVAFARQAFNDAVTSYNTHRETFPNILVANVFNFRSQALRARTDKEREAPRVSF